MMKIVYQRTEVNVEGIMGTFERRKFQPKVTSRERSRKGNVSECLKKSKEVDRE